MKIRPNYIYAFVSMTLVLFLASVFGSIILQSHHLVRLFKERVMIVVEVENGYPASAVKELETVITAKEYVKSGTVEYTSKIEAAKLMQQDFGDEVDMEQFNLVNPLYDIITFHVKANFMDTKQLDTIAVALKGDERVSDVTYEGSIAGTISNYWSRVGWIGLGISFILILVAVFLIVYAVRQALYTDRFLIKNMHLVGATPSFINRPYAIRGIIGGALSALTAGGGLMLVRTWLIAQMPDIETLFPLSSVWFIMGVMLLIGVVITTTCTWLTVRRYLKSDVNDLYQ